MTSAAELLADLLAPWRTGEAGGTPANAANPANREHPCGPAVDSGAAKALRMPAKDAPDSQTFAAFRSVPNGPESEQACGLSQDSQVSQALPDDCTAQRVARAVRLGFQQVDAETIARRLLIRDRDGDDRVICAECAHYRPMRCGNHSGALLSWHELAHEMVMLLQRCPGYMAATSGAQNVWMRAVRQPPVPALGESSPVSDHSNAGHSGAGSPMRFDEKQSNQFTKREVRNQ